MPSEGIGWNWNACRFVEKIGNRFSVFGKIGSLCLITIYTRYDPESGAKITSCKVIGPTVVIMTRFSVFNAKNYRFPIRADSFQS